MPADAQALRPILDDAMEIVAMTDDRARQLVGPVLRHLIAMEALGCDVEPLLDALKACCDYNNQLHDRARTICQRVEALTRGQMNPLTVRSIIGALREPLAVLAHPDGYDTAAYVAASAAVKSVIAQVAPEKLLADSVRTNLGPNRHDLLRSLIDSDRLELVA